MRFICSHGCPSLAYVSESRGDLARFDAAFEDTADVRVTSTLIRASNDVGKMVAVENKFNIMLICNLPFIHGLRPTYITYTGGRGAFALWILGIVYFTK